jgi:preprotein translocase subunit SecE
VKAMQYIKDSYKELKKVHWPDRPKVMETSLIVTGCTAVFAAYLWLVDLAISQVFTVIFYQ